MYYMYFLYWMYYVYYLLSRGWCGQTVPRALCSLG